MNVFTIALVLAGLLVSLYGLYLLLLSIAALFYSEPTQHVTTRGWWS